MVAIVSLIAAGPDILVLDEPSSFLDEESLKWFTAALSESMDHGMIKACVMSTQDKRLLAVMGDSARIHRLPDLGGVTYDVTRAVEDLVATMNLAPYLESGLLALESYSVRTAVTEFPFGDLCLSPGEHAVIIGGNGSGKSTFCDALTGHRRERISGVIRIGDWSQHLGFRRFAVPPHVAYVFQNAEDQITHADLGRELLMPRKAQNWKGQGAALLTHIARGGLDSWKLSYGQRRLLAILSLSFSSAVLLLDEPFSCLDEKSSAILHDLLDDYLRCGGIVIETAASDSGQPRPGVRTFELHRGRLAARS